MDGTGPGDNVLFDLGEPLATPEPAGSGGTPRLRYANREQAEMRFCALDELIAVDHEVRQVWAYVAGLDLSEVLAKIKAVEGGQGQGQGPT